MTAKKKPDWFACYPEKWLNALYGMKPMQQHVYWIICLRIYDRHGPIHDSIDALSHRIGYRRPEVERSIDALVRQGKLFRTQDGGLMNAFCQQEIEACDTKRRSKADRIRSESVSNPSSTDEKTQQIQGNDSLQYNTEQYKEEGSIYIERGPSGYARRQARQTPLPRQLSLSDEWKQWALAEGFEADEVEAGFRAFCAHYWGSGALQADWFCKYQQWFLNKITWGEQRKLQRQRNGGEHGQRGSRALSQTGGSTAEAGRRLIEAARRGEFKFEPRPRLYPDESYRDLRVLPEK